jgi:hypothetical protein
LAIPMNDYYMHPNDVNSSQINVDRIGSDPPFEIWGHDWASPGVFRLYLDWTPGYGLNGSWGGQVQLGDLIFYDSSGQKYAIALRNHTNENDEILMGNVFEVTQERTSDYYFGAGGIFGQQSTSWYGDNELVTADGNVLGQAAIGFFDGGKKNTYITVDLGIFDSLGFDPDTFRFAYTCANDIIVAPVPEATPLLLVGCGLLCVAVLARRKTEHTQI